MQLAKFELSPNLRPLRLQKRGYPTDSDWFQSDYEEELVNIELQDEHSQSFNSSNVIQEHQHYVSDMNLLKYVEVN